MQFVIAAVTVAVAVADVAAVAAAAAALTIFVIHVYALVVQHVCAFIRRLLPFPQKM